MNEPDRKIRGGSWFDLARKFGQPLTREQIRQVFASLGKRRSASKAEDQNTDREWSETDLFTLVKMLLRGHSIAEIASALGRNRRDIRSKVMELGDAGKRGLGSG